MELLWCLPPSFGNYNMGYFKEIYYCHLQRSVDNFITVQETHHHFL